MIRAEYKTVDKRKILINDNELSARLGRICSHTDPELSRVCETLIQTAEPRYAATRVELNWVGEYTVDLGFGEVTSVALTKNLHGCRECFVLVVTLGAAVDRLLSRIAVASAAEAYIYDAVASALTEAAVEVAVAELSAGTPCRVRFSPGYSDFSIEHQGALLAHLGAPEHLGVCLGEGYLMTPKKTVSAVMGICPEEDKSHPV